MKSSEEYGVDARNRATGQGGFLLNSKNRKYRGGPAAGPPGGRQLLPGSPPRQSGPQGEQTDWLVPVCRGPLGLFIGRPAWPCPGPAAGSQARPSIQVQVTLGSPTRRR
jgi:hypothetical protein